MQQWRRTLYTVWITQFIAVMGFSFVMPFMPYYIQELGITDVKQVSMWAGLITSAQAIGMALMAPVWGALADRYGRKLMVLRATFAGAIVLSLMGFAANVQQLLVMRFVQGIFTGTVAATTTLVASTVPRERSGMALGSLQTAIFLGVALGPLLGGVTGDALGYRPSFWVTGALLFLSGVLVLLFVHEDFPPAADAAPKGRINGRFFSYAPAARLVLASGPLLAVFASRILLRVGTRALDPMLPLFVQTLIPAGGQVGATTGIISAVSGLGSAVGSPVIGGWSDRFGQRRLLIACAAIAGACYIPQAFVQDARWLIFWQLCSGLAVGGTLATVTALLTHVAPRGHEGMVFGLDTSAVSGANAIGPLLGAAAAASWGLRAPFWLAALMFGAGLLAVIFWVHDGNQTIATENGRTR